MISVLKGPWYSRYHQVGGIRYRRGWLTGYCCHAPWHLGTDCPFPPRSWISLDNLRSIRQPYTCSSTFKKSKTFSVANFRKQAFLLTCEVFEKRKTIVHVQMHRSTFKRSQRQMFRDSDSSRCNGTSQNVRTFYGNRAHMFWITLNTNTDMTLNNQVIICIIISLHNFTLLGAWNSKSQ